MSTRLNSPEIILPDWPAPTNVRAMVTTRRGGVSTGAWESFNLGLNCGDAVEAVHENRRVLESLLPAPVQWLNQVHGNDFVIHDGNTRHTPVADAIISSRPGQVCGILTADCLPVFFTDTVGCQVGIAHAGWRGLAAGVLERTCSAMDAGASEIIAWLGPGIGPDQYEVGAEVRRAFIDHEPAARQAFVASGDRWLADLYMLARQRLTACGIRQIHGGELCTFSDEGRFYSYRRDGASGRMASLIWLEPA